jgi:23S rRNA pseudouridine1911/1915/1917 synthase
MSPAHSMDSRIKDAGLEGMRVDVFIAEHLGLFSRSQVKARVTSITVNGVSARLSRRLSVGDIVSLAWEDPPSSQLEPQDIPLAVMFQNEDATVVDKPQGMVVHPGSGNHSGTLVNALLFHDRRLAEGFASGTPRPGIVHRLDKDTSGVIVVARNARAHEALAAQFRDRSARKRYLAIVCGRLPAAEGRIATRLARDPRNRKRFACTASGGRIAITRYRVLRCFERAAEAWSLVLLAPRTGRTHQLRVHLRHLGAPILGDPIYGKPCPRFPGATLMLHARSLAIRLPGEADVRTFVSPLPERFEQVLTALQNLSPRKGL